MPNYSFTCKKCYCHFDVNLSMDERNKKQKCKCGGELVRTIDASSLGGMDKLGRSQ